MLVSDSLDWVEVSPADRLNPCFSGCWSRTLGEHCAPLSETDVLILVLVDVGLGRRGYEGRA